MRPGLLQCGATPGLEPQIAHACAGLGRPLDNDIAAARIAAFLKDRA